MAHVDSEPVAIDQWTDPIVAEVWAVREAIAARYDYDIDRIAAAFIEWAKAGGHKVVRGKPAGDRQASPQPPKAS